MEKLGFVAYFYHSSWAYVSLGFHIDFSNPNLEIHLPFGFIRIGWISICDAGKPYMFGYECGKFRFGKDD